MKRAIWPYLYLLIQNALSVDDSINYFIVILKILLDGLDAVTE